MPDVVDPSQRQGFDAAAGRAVALAHFEARQLGHDRVGTEHLFLGLLTNESATSKTLTDAGVTLAAARSKVDEAVGTSSREDPAAPAGPLPRTPRATRALGRSVRFAHAAGCQVVMSQHVLMGVLDVEGAAGQVLRGLGLDVELLRAALDALVEAPSPHRTTESPECDPGTLRPATCPSCSASLDQELVYRVVTAVGAPGPTRNAVIYECGSCGRFLGVGPT